MSNGIKMVKVRNTFESRDRSEKIFTLCTVENYKLIEQISKFNWKMPIVRTDSKQHGKESSFSKCLQPKKFPEKRERYDPHKYFKAPFNKSRMALFPLEKMGVDNFITDNERSRIAHYIVSHTEQPKLSLSEDPRKGQRNYKSAQNIEMSRLGIANLIETKLYTDAYPVHSGPYLWSRNNEKLLGKWENNIKLLTDRQKLFYSWSCRKAFFKQQPLEQVRRYFGEKTGLYFAWLGFYARWMLYPALFGLIVFVLGWILLFFDPVVNTACSEEPQPDLVLCPTCDFCGFSLINSACQQGTLNFRPNVFCHF